MRLVYHPPANKGECGELRTEPEYRDGIGWVDILVAQIVPQGDDIGLHGAFVASACAKHEKYARVVEAAAALKGVTTEITALKSLATDAAK